MKLPGKSNSNWSTGALALAAVLAFSCAGMGADPAEARGRKAPEADVMGPAGDYPVLLGDPFMIDGMTYTPADTMNYDAVGRAVPNDADEGALRISGAHRTLPVPSYVEVTALDSGRTILLRLDQRGPMRGDALVALSPLAWSQLGLPMMGAAAVRVRRVNPPEQERALLRTGQAAPLRMDTPPGLLAALRRKLSAEPSISVLPVTVRPADIVTPPPTKPSSVHKPALPARPAPRPVPVVTSAPDEPERHATRAAAPATRYYVQIGAFAQRSNADATARRSGGAVVRAGNIWRVRSGPFSAGTEADSALAKARRAGYAGARTVRD